MDHGGHHGPTVVFAEHRFFFALLIGHPMDHVGVLRFMVPNIFFLLFSVFFFFFSVIPFSFLSIFFSVFFFVEKLPRNENKRYKRG